MEIKSFQRLIWVPIRCACLFLMCYWIVKHHFSNKVLWFAFRFGVTAFTNHQTPEVAILHLEETMLAFKHLMRTNDVIHYKGCATHIMPDVSSNETVDHSSTVPGRFINLASNIIVSARVVLSLFVATKSPSSWCACHSKLS